MSRLRRLRDPLASGAAIHEARAVLAEQIRNLTLQHLEENALSASKPVGT